MIAATGRFTLYAPTQSVLASRATAAEILKVPASKLRFVARNVGGSFGMKGAIFPEYICALHAARELGRPIKWTDRRSDSFVSDHHGRDLDFDVELALDKDGHFLALRANGFANLGGYLTMIGAAVRDGQHRQAHQQLLPHAADRGEHALRLHQYEPGHHLSRRRPAGRQLHHGADDRHGRCRNGHRSGRAAPPQSYRPE